MYRTCVYKYLGTVINDKEGQQKTVRSRIGQVRYAFTNLRSPPCNQRLKLHLTRIFFKYYVLSVLLYGV